MACARKYSAAKVPRSIAQYYLSRTRSDSRTIEVCLEKATSTSSSEHIVSKVRDLDFDSKNCRPALRRASSRIERHRPFPAHAPAPNSDLDSRVSFFATHSHQHLGLECFVSDLAPIESVSDFKATETCLARVCVKRSRDRLDKSSPPLSLSKFNARIPRSIRRTPR